VAITRDDYESLAEAYTDPISGSVAVAQAFVARSADDDLQLQVFLNNIRVIVANLSASVKAETAGIEADVSGTGNLEELRDSIDADVTAATDQVSAADTAVDNAGNSVQLLKNKANQILVDAADIQVLVIDGKADVDASTASIPEKTAINGFFDAIATEAADITTGATGIGADASATQSQLSSAGEATDQAAVELATATASLALVTPLLSDISARVVVIDGLMDSGFAAAVETELGDIFSHVDGFLAADCQANLIQVPILTRDANGFLSPPPIALVRSLQDFLNERKEVTQDPEVVSGAAALVPAALTAKIGILPGFIQATVLSNVRKAVDELLRVRAFGASLRTSDLDTVTSPNPQTGIGGVDGVKYSVYTIDGSIGPLGTLVPDFLNLDGNLIIDKRFVITKGTVVLTPEAAAA